ncbi:cytochrome c [Mesorhizobium sp. M2D.F.Ca.ET.185.01.1.1]|uniref:cytochrome c n=1 Tax=unclassified Mesorhizobium TaxID=325217 RepID=UPI000FCB0893|nr:MULTISPECIES: cytochrome c [unclassified Mesorhizobium]TGP77063.1 cytochrome c [bacterium M00.F.Ca.ET.227.01.1.1]TGP84070.1 cytochrome c [bacterium M00.F.Ca.ET.221.01.1.1]TGP88579.1 cytochrome c [bacterium M00.F.Ca.ET.222.01.1.1]TGU03143.1 cytochrome c [bacterium M00.F.Ca.ET.163.01.1.1]TGU30810.1 cytochrome c [bacterium M00.F.Ca.ET.156.01.1.1]TGU45066.1 cytochrome c [bacterium M00.F.Ca.ET.146.01.1.1]TGV67542.1 cytochrome c [Mesorhizobium sp. M2D.F.Ca.ET.160.01.1.1]TGV81530.1 cytochrome c
MRDRIVVAAAMLALAGLLILTPSLAAGPGDPIVAARQASMKQMAAAARAIAEMFDGKRAYEPAAFKAAADTLSARAGALTGEFPQGTHGAPSAARPEIDDARPEFEALARHIGRLADALADKAGNAPPGITADMRMSGPPMDGGSLLGKRPGAVEADPAKMPAEHLLHLILQDCTSCHSKFRRKAE